MEAKKKIEVRETAKWLLFDSEEEFVEFCKKNGLSLVKKYSKSRKEDIWAVAEGNLVKQVVEDNNFVPFVESKRNKSYFLVEDEELIDDKYMTKSFFAFGDFRESVNPKYMTTLCRKLREGS